MKKNRIAAQAVRLEGLTPMIDVVFLLLIFFIVVFRPVEVIGRLDADSPGEASVGTPFVPVVITVNPDGLILESRPVSVPAMKAELGRLARHSTNQPVLVVCSLRSRHDDLVAVLDACAEAGLCRIDLTSKRTAGE